MAMGSGPACGEVLSLVLLLVGLLAAEPTFHKQAVEAFEHLSKPERIEGCYAGVAVAASHPFP
jgi:hypothetical protein